jgi:hypothetical protein
MGGGGVPGPGVGGANGAIGMVSGWSSTVLAMNIPGEVYSCPLSSEKCSWHKSSRPGDDACHCSRWPRAAESHAQELASYTWAARDAIPPTDQRCQSG